MVTVNEKALPVPPYVPGFYVSVIDGARRRLVRGPYDTHEQALAAVEPVRNEWADLDSRSWWYSWGTARVRPEDAHGTK